MARSKVPKFGGWEGEEDVGYTVRFDTVRNRKPGGPIINPNDPQANQFTSPPPATAAAPPQQTKPTPPQQTKPKPKKPEFGAWDEQEVPYTQYFDDKAKVNAGGQSEPQMNYNVAPTQPPKTNPKKPEFGAWDEQEVPYTEYFDSRAKVNAGGQSEPQINYNVAPTQPLKPNPVVKSNETIPRPHGGRGVNSADPRAKPPGVKFVESESNSRQSPLHQGAAGRGRGTTPVGPRQRTHPTAGPSPGRGGASVPKFGDWNNGQADGYTVVFNNLQKERKGVEPSNNNPTHANQSSGRSPPPKQGGCLSWLLG